MTTWISRCWTASLFVHAAALMTLMVGSAALIGTGSPLVDDEGAGILQAQAIEHGHWTVANPLPSVDPGGAAYPIHQPLRGSKGNAPVGKNLAYFVILAGFGFVLGTAGMVGLSIAGTVAAALLAARLAREIGTSERAAFWLVGLASPLFFDGFLVVAHTVAAALAAASALFSLWFLKDGRWRNLLGAVLCVGCATLLRTEAALWALGLAGGVMAASFGPWARLAHSRRGLFLAVGSGTGMVVAREASAFITHLAIGSAVAAPPGSVPDTGASGTVRDQIAGLLRSWFELTGASATLTIILGILLALLAVWARAAQQGQAGSRFTIAMAATVAACSIYVAYSRPNQYIAGIAIVFPVLWAGLWLLGSASLRDSTGRVLIVSSAIYAILVSATQYSDAGAWQPGRYFFLAMPIMVPVVVSAFSPFLRQCSLDSRRLVVALAIVGIVATSTSAIGDLRTSHQRNGAMATAVRQIAPEADPGDGGRPVIVTTYPFLPRLEAATFPDVRWQLVREDRLAGYFAALSRVGIRSFVLVTTDPQVELKALDKSYTPTKAESLPAAPQWRLIILRHI